MEKTPVTNFSRRNFLKSSGSLVLGFQLVPLLSCTGNANSLPELLDGLPVRPHGDKDLIDSWIRLDADGRVTILTGKQELGQGIRITLIQMAAEELDVPIGICDIINGDTSQTANEGYTAGSNSVEGSGKAIRQAAAEAKLYMLNLAAQTWKEDILNLSVEKGIIRSKSNKEISYWKLLEGKFLQGKITGKAIPKSYQEHQVVGKPIFRDDIKNMVMGKAHFVHDLRMDGMVHARVLHPPSYAAKLKTTDFSEVQGLPGVLKVISNGSFLAVIAVREYQAVKAWLYLKAICDWEVSKIKVAQASLFEDIKAKSMSPETIENSPDLETQFENASEKVKQEYHRPYHMHASTGPSCAVAEWKAGNLTVWSPTQGVYPLQNSLSDLLELSKENIRCIGMPGSGCYGHNGADDVSAEVALIAREFPEKPIRLQWMREDEHQWEPYGSAMLVQLEAGLDNEGKIIAWDTKLFSDTHSTRPNGNGGHYISARYLEKPFEFRKGGFSGGSYRNAVPLYTIPSKRLLLHNYEGPLRTSALRGLGAYGNIFALESFMDELAMAAEMDPIDFRIKNLDDDRAKAVLQSLSEKTNWKSGQKVPNKGFGVAFSKYKNSASYFAVVAEVTVDRDSKSFRLDKLTGVIDSGQCINPDGLKNQTEGGMIQSASWTLLEKVNFDEDGIQSIDWDSYPILRSKEVPVVEVHIINRPELAPMGAGEAAQGPVAAAIANAVFNGTGTRVRNLPIQSEKIDWGKV